MPTIYLNNFKKQRYNQKESKFKGLYSPNNLSNILEK